MRLIFFGLIFLGLSNIANAIDIYTTTSTGASVSWDSNIWTTTSGGGVQNGLRPQTGDAVVINRSVTINITAIGSNPLSTPFVSITINGGRTLTVTSLGTLNYTTITINPSCTLTTNPGASGLSGGNITNNGTLNFNGSNMSAVDILNSGAFIVGGSGIITLTGNFSDNGGYNDTSGGTVTFSGTSQTVTSTQASFSTSFTIVNVNSGTVNFASVANASININTLNIVSGANAVVSNGAHVNLTGPLMLNGTATFDADGAGGTGVFTLISTDEFTHGSIGRLLTPANFTGNVSVQRYIPVVVSGLGSYTYLSTPITNGFLSAWKAAFGVTGNFSDRSTNAEFGNIRDAGNTAPSVFEWNPAMQDYVGLTGGTIAATAISNTKAYVAYNFSSIPVTATYTGSIAKGNVSIPISTVADQYTLIPNPYPCSVNWGSLYGSNNNDNSVMEDFYWRHIDGSTSNNAGNITVPGDPNEPTGTEIALGQSVWVVTKSSPASSSLVFSETNKTYVNGPFLREESPINYFRIDLRSATQRDQVVIRFNPISTDSRDERLDAPKVYNGAYNSTTKLYSLINLSTFNVPGDKDYAINSVAEMSSCSKVIGMRVADTKPGDYTLKFTELDKLELDYKVVLVDHFLNKEKTVTDNMEYPFSVTADAASLGSERFQVRFEKPVVVPSLSVQDKTLVSNLESDNQWYKDGAAIDGANAATYSATASGVYTVKRVNGTCESSATNMVMALRNDTQVTGCSKAVGVKVINASQGDYTLKFNGLSSVKGYSINLVDKFLSTEKPVDDNAEYSFNITSDANSFGEGRFEILFTKNSTVPVVTVQGQTLVSSAEENNQWYKNGQPISGATASSYDVVESGTYTVKNTTNGCETAAENITMTITALPEVANEKSTVYPNPTTGKIFINLPSEKDAILTGVYLYDLKGSVIVDSEKTSNLLQAGEKSIDITSSRNGVYILNLVSDKEIKSIRVIKK